MVGYLAHAHGDFTLGLEYYKGCGMLPSEVSELGSNMVELEDRDMRLQQEVSSRDRALGVAKKFEDFVDATMDVMKSEIVAFLQVTVDNVKAVNPKFPLGKVRSHQDFMDGVYVCPTPLTETLETSTAEGEIPVKESKVAKGTHVPPVEGETIDAPAPPSPTF